jgi:hypothetical protein
MAYRFFLFKICTKIQNIYFITLVSYIAIDTYNTLTYLLRGLSPQTNYTDQATAASRES